MLALKQITNKTVRELSVKNKQKMDNGAVKILNVSQSALTITIHIFSILAFKDST